MQISNTIPEKGLWNLRLSDLWKGFIKSCGGLIVGLVIKLVQDKFKLPSYEEIEPLLEATAYFFLAYMGLNYSTNNVGKLFQSDKQVVSVDVNALKDLQDKADVAENKTDLSSMKTAAPGDQEIQNKK